jgi:UDP-3-O-[3-hydroxymyristoyl] glucosamine N-acyltransferase
VNKKLTIQQINDLLGGQLIGSTDQLISGPEQIDKAQVDHITFIGNRRYLKAWPESKACAVIVHQKWDLEPQHNRAIIKVANPDLAMIKVLEAFDPGIPEISKTIHATAVVEDSATIQEGAKIGAGCYIGHNVVIGKNVMIYPNVTIMDDTSIGDGSIIWPGTVIRERSIIGRNCIFHINVSIGADGFGYRPREDGRGLAKVPQIGNVVIGNEVEIGANSCVDRGKFSSTIIGDGCKIDNLVQIAHNCVMGRSCIMAGHSGLAGSVTLGDGVVIGGSASIKDHTTIHSGATVGAGSGVIGDVEAGATVLGYPACDAREKLKQWVAVKKLVK